MGRADHASATSAETGYWEQRGYDVDAWVGRSNGFVTRGYVERFSRTERALHWVHATALLRPARHRARALPAAPERSLVGRRPLVKDIHFYTAVAWVAVLALVVVLGDRRGLRRTAARARRLRRDDLRWLAAAARAPQGRFNAGQKINAALTAAFAVLFVVSGLLLWLGERDTASASRARSCSTTG